jgi:8-oxo-dGTP pyrophosphatase MutT (NUDIX family)
VPHRQLPTEPPPDPWRTLTSREVYANPWIRVREDQVLRPDGSPGLYGVVSMTPAVGVVALTDAEEVVMVGQWRYALGEYSWELVEGGVDAGEDPLTAIQRELAEEAGYHASSWAPLGPPLSVSNSVTDQRGQLFVARGLRTVPRAPDPTEALVVAHLPVEEALDLIDRGRISDSLTILGLLAYDRARRAG